ncbi:MAG TPA: 2OG-Fe(II) oxygenase [Reyranellaceae bacterium]|nr:2OG-Fe(II) oxygenase [Reyranellaceae bacterium]
MTAELWREAEAARAAGDKPAARAVLLRLLEGAPHHVAALKALAALSEDAGERRDLEQRAADAAVEESLAIALSLQDGPLRAKAEALARRAVADRPHSPRAHRVLVDLLRRHGRLAEAEAAARGMPAWTGADAPLPAVPYALFEGFLDAQRHREVLDFALARGAAFERAMVGGDDSEWKVEPEARIAQAAYDVAPLREWFMPLIEARLPETLSRLGMAPFTPGELELQLTAYNDGEYYKTHADRDEAGLVKRQLTFVYYFNRTPKAFEGGDLLLYDGDAAANLFSQHHFTRVTPVDNRLIFFPSSAQHEVSMVRCPSRAYEDSRFTLNGWVNRA